MKTCEVHLIFRQKQKLGVVGVASLRNVGLPVLCTFTDTRNGALTIMYIRLQHLPLSVRVYLLLSPFTRALGFPHPVRVFRHVVIVRRGIELTQG